MHLKKALIVGFGSIARRHGKNLKALGINKILVCDTDASRRAAADQELGSKTFENLENALNENPNAVFICTPPNSHVAIATAAAQHGCHLFVEKPLSNRY